MKSIILLVFLGVIYSVLNQKQAFANEFDEFLEKPLEKPLTENQVSRSLRANKMDGFAVNNYDSIRDVVANCSKSLSETFGIGQYEAIFNQSLTANFMSQAASFPPGVDYALSVFCEAVTQGIDTFLASGQKIMSMAPYNPFSSFFNLETNNQGFNQYTTRNVAEALLAALGSHHGELQQLEQFDQDSNPRKLQEVETFVSEAQKVIQQLGQNVGSMFGIGSFDAAMANSFLEGFLGTLGTNSNVAGIFTGALDQLLNTNPMNIASGMSDIPLFSHITEPLGQM